jgi:hypothetical protein
MILRFWRSVYMPKLAQIVYTLDLFARKWGDVPLLARTHGQPASPTRMGKELMVFVDRLKAQMELMESVPHCCKFGGATGNLNAHRVAFPDRDWVSITLLMRSMRGERRLKVLVACRCRSRTSSPSRSDCSACSAPPRSSTTTTWRRSSTRRSGSTPSSWTSAATSGATSHSASSSRRPRSVARIAAPLVGRGHWTCAHAPAHSCRMRGTRKLAGLNKLSRACSASSVLR